jgi:hypothetical protein
MPARGTRNMAPKNRNLTDDRSITRRNLSFRKASRRWQVPFHVPTSACQSVASTGTGFMMELSLCCLSAASGSDSGLMGCTARSLCLWRDLDGFLRYSKGRLKFLQTSIDPIYSFEYFANQQREMIVSRQFMTCSRVCIGASLCEQRIENSAWTQKLESYSSES